MANAGFDQCTKIIYLINLGTFHWGKEEDTFFQIVSYSQAQYKFPRHEYGIPC